ncbi:type I-E CRISPR-associated protein Cas5/CasD [Streptomyces sp. NPDC046925]|uniref:type I-E CRISPR-associated protein Cas5/CasD n=1 Tax=Streptomyces sp. NPDC046925 TaxID=3155375 RepID=UPI0033F1D21C
MTHTLLLRLEGILQAWGTHSRFADRDSASHPTKSGVIGLLAAADGHDRDEHRTADDDFLPLSTLANLRFGVRADRPGTLVRDFHTAGGGTYPVRPRDIITDPYRAQHATTAPVPATSRAFTRRAGETLADWYGAPKNIAPDRDTGALTAGNNRRHPLVAAHWYLADAAFLAAVQSEDTALLKRLARRLNAPHRLLWLGRKNCVPHHDLHHGLHRGDIETVLATIPLLPRSPHPTCTAWIEAPHHTPNATPVNDQPLSYASRTRSHAPRFETRHTLTPPGAPA